MKQRILIIGSSGMLGVDLSQELQHDYEVIGCDVIPVALRHYEDIQVNRPGLGMSIHTNSPGLNTKMGCVIPQFFKCNITKKIEVSRIINKARPDIVIHAAAMTDVDGCELDPKRAYKINSDGTKNVAQVCKRIGATLIYISTDFVFDGRKKRPYKETDKPNPLSIYGDSKRKGEIAIRRVLKNHFILRTSWLYGKHGKNFVDTIISKAESAKVLKVVDDQVGSPTYTKDLAKAIHVLIEKISNGFGIYHVSNSGAVSWYDYAREIVKLAERRNRRGCTVVPISSEELDRPAKRPAMSVLDNSKFTELTGCRMRNWQEALKEYMS